MARDRSDFERRTLADRTRAAAEPIRLPRRSEAEGIDFVTGGERHAIAFDVLEGIRPLPALTPVPRAPPLLAGLMLYEGRIVPVFDLSVLLDLPPPPEQEPAFVLLLGRGTVELGLRVERIGGLVALTPERPIVPGHGALPEWIRGIGPAGIPVIDGARLLASERLVIDLSPSGPTEALRRREVP